MPIVHRSAQVLWLLAAAFLVAVVATRAVFLWVDHRQTLDRGRDAAADLSLVVEEYARRVFETAHLLSEDVERAVRQSGGLGVGLDAAEAHRILVGRMLQTASNDYLMIVDRRGVPFALSDRFPAPETPLADRPWFRAHSEEGSKTHIGSALFSRITGEMLFTFSRRLDVDGRFDGVVQVAMRPAFLENAARASGLDEAIRLTIVGSSDGRIVAQTGLTPDRAGAQAVLWPLIAGAEAASGVQRVRDPQTGEDRILAYRRLRDWPVVATATVPVSAILAPWYRNAAISSGVLAVLLLPLAWLTWVGLRLARQEEAVRGELVRSNEDLAAALSDRDMLLREVHHRVKNNLQVTSSLLSMQALRFQDTEVRAAFEQTQERLQSIALVHETLYRRDMSASVDLSDYLGRLVDWLAEGHGARERGIAVRVDVEPVSLGLERAVPLALCVTEAVANAFKHAFPPGAEGDGGVAVRNEVSVSAKRMEGDVLVEVRDTGRGVGADGGGSDASLGMTLMRVLSGQLGGRFEIESGRGTVFRLVAPIAA
jgi:two-component sensor histidine kinase